MIGAVNIDAVGEAGGVDESDVAAGAYESEWNADDDVFLVLTRANEDDLVRRSCRDSRADGTEAAGCAMGIDAGRGAGDLRHTSKE